MNFSFNNQLKTLFEVLKLNGFLGYTWYLN